MPNNSRPVPLSAIGSSAGSRFARSASVLRSPVTAQTRTSRGEGNVVGRDLGASSGFGVFSVNGAYRIGRNLRLGAGVDNLFDRAYAEHLNLAGNSAFGYPAEPMRISEPGRTVWMKLSVEY